MIERVSIDGTDLALLDVFAAVTIRHGRGSIEDSPIGSTATLTLLNVDRAFTRAFRVGGELELDTTGAVPRFRGRITDAALEPDEDEPTLSVIAVSSLARIAGRPVGAVAWAAESWSSRVTRAFTEAGELALLELEVGTDDPPLAARDAEEASLAEILEELASTVPATVADLPDGRVLVQAYSTRQGRTPVELDPLSVAYPTAWAQTDDTRNVVRVEWAGGTVERTDSGSISDLEEREPLTITTALAVESDAVERALLELNRRGRPEWTLDSVELLELDPALEIGAPVRIPSLPPAAPLAEAIRILEGWEDHVEGDEWTMMLALSPPALSGFGISWNLLEPTLAWEDVPAAVTWADAEELTLA